MSEFPAKNMSQVCHLHSVFVRTNLNTKNMTFDICFCFFSFISYRSNQLKLVSLICCGQQKGWNQHLTKTKLIFFSSRFASDSHWILKTKSEAQLDLFKECFHIKNNQATEMEMKTSELKKRKAKECNWKTYKLIENGNYFFIFLQIFLLSFLLFFTFSSLPALSRHFILKCRKDVFFCLFPSY